MKILQVQVLDEMSIHDIELALQSGYTKRDAVSHRDECRLAAVRNGTYAMKVPIGYSRAKDGSLIVNHTQARHVITMALLAFLGRISPHHELGRFTNGDIHQEYLNQTRKTHKRIDPSFVRAVLHRRVYLGEVWYRKRIQATCQSIFPVELYDLVHESAAIVVPPYQRNPGWKRRKREMTHETYTKVFSQAEAALNVWLDGEHAVPFFEQVEIDLYGLACQLFTFKSPQKRVRRPFECLKHYRTHA